MKRSATAALLLAALSGPSPGVASDRPVWSRAPASLCRVPETVLFTCGIGTRVVSICGQARNGQAPGTAVYRFGRPGHIELEVTGLHHAGRGYSGGGDAEVYADSPTHRYVVYDTIVRTGFGPDGHFDPQEVFGLLVQNGGKTVSNRTCIKPTDLDPLVETLMPKGDYVDHVVTLRPSPPDTEQSLGNGWNMPGGFEDNPDAMAEPQNAANSAAVWWENNRLEGQTLAILDRMQFDAITRTVNAGKRDAQKRWEATQRALDAFGIAR